MSNTFLPMLALPKPTRFQSPLFLQQPRISQSREEARERGYLQAIKDSLILDTSVGQATMMIATAKAFNVPVASISRRVQEGYSPFRDDDLSAYTQFLSEFAESTSPEETAMIKQMIDNNRDLRTNLEDYGFTRFLSGFLDPVNLLPVPFALGKGFIKGAAVALRRGTPIIVTTELIRHDIDPTSTKLETMFATVGGTVFMGLMGGVIGKVPKNTMTVSEALGKMTPPPGTTSMFGVWGRMGGSPKAVFKRLHDSLNSTAGDGMHLSKSVDPDSLKIKTFEPRNVKGSGKVEDVEVRLDGEGVILEARIKGDTLHVVEVFVPKGLRKKGIATAAYKMMITLAESRGLRFVSDTQVSKAAQKRYAGLQEEGFSVKKIDDKKIDIDDDGTMHSKDGKTPIFEIKKLIDPDAVQIPKGERDSLAAFAKAVKLLKLERAENTIALKLATKAFKTATRKGGWKTKRQNTIKELLKAEQRIDSDLRIAQSHHDDLNVALVNMLDEATIKDWDLLPTGYNALLGKLDQWPWWGLMKTPLRKLAPDLAVKYQLFALKMGATPGLNNRGNRLNSSSGPSIESLTIIYTGRWLAAVRKADAIYRKYLGHGTTSGQMKSFIIDSAQRVKSSVSEMAGQGKIKETSDGKLTIEEFQFQISMAIVDKGKHSVAEVAEASQDFMRVLKELGEEGKELNIFAAQRSLEKNISRLDEAAIKWGEVKEKWDNIADGWAEDHMHIPQRVVDVQNKMEGILDDITIERAEMVDRQAAFLSADIAEAKQGFIHRMWLDHEVRAKKDLLIEYLTKEFTKNPSKGFTEVRIDDMTFKIDNADPEAIAARVNEAYNSILKDAQYGGNADFVMKNGDKKDYLMARRDRLNEELDVELAGNKTFTESREAREFIKAIRDNQILNDPGQIELHDGINLVELDLRFDTIAVKEGRKTGKQKVEIVKNPTRESLARWAGREIDEVRIAVDAEGNLYVWDARGPALHDDLVGAGLPVEQHGGIGKDGGHKVKDLFDMFKREFDSELKFRIEDSGSNKTGTEISNFIPKLALDEIELRLKESIELTGAQKQASVEVAAIDRKLARIAGGDISSGASGPLISRRLDLDDKKLLEMGVIEGNVNNWMNHYVQRIGPVLETARMFGDNRAQKHIDDLTMETYARAGEETDPVKQAALIDAADKGRMHMNDLRDIVHGVWQIPDNPSAMSGRVLRALRNFNVLGSMGRSVLMAFGDIGNVVISQGLIRSMRQALEHYSSGITDGKIKMMRDEVDLAGSVSEVLLGMRYQQMTEMGGAVANTTKFERGLAEAAQRFFLFNLLGPWTDMARRFSGGMLQSRLIENSVKWKLGKLSEDEKTIMTRLGISRQQAIQFADEWQSSGSLKHKTMFIAQTESWASETAKRVFRAAMNTEINRMVPTPGAVDKPKALLKSEWWKIMGQYRGFSIGATHRIMGAAIHQPGMQKWSGLASMVGIAMMVDSFKRPDYIKLPLEEQVLRAVELSGVTGIILDLNDTLERASAGAIGVRPALGMDIRERNPNWSNRIGTIGAVPNQFLALTYAMVSDEATTDDTARAIRYMIPYNNLIWWNSVFNRAQRSSVDFFEE